jgi:eukaryotic-like serine/threonine-protein kinase
MNPPRQLVRRIRFVTKLRLMKTTGVVLIAMATSLVTSAGVVYASHRWGSSLMADAPAKLPVAPNLGGLTEADARTNLEAVGLKMMVAARELDANAKEGTVISQTPKPGEPVGDDRAVQLTFALAMPKPPDVVGKSLEEARKALENAGFDVKVAAAVASKTAPKDTVVTQKQSKAPTAKEKGEITLEPSAGTGEVVVPKLTGLSLVSATEEAKKVGLEVTAQYVSLPETATYVVLSQKPPPDEKLAPGEKVTVVINQ